MLALNLNVNFLCYYDLTSKNYLTSKNLLDIFQENENDQYNFYYTHKFGEDIYWELMEKFNDYIQPKWETFRAFYIKQYL